MLKIKSNQFLLEKYIYHIKENFFESFFSSSLKKKNLLRITSVAEDVTDAVHYFRKRERAWSWETVRCGGG